MKVRRGIKISGLIFLLLIVGAGIGVFILLWSPEVSAFVVTQYEDKADLETTALIQFNKPVNRRALVPNIEPYVDGYWEYEESWLGKHFFSALRFVPAHTLDPATTYQITLQGITDALTWSDPKNYTADFSTRSLPNVESVIPADSMEDIAPDEAILVRLSEPAGNYVQLYARVTPAADFTLSQNGELDEFVITPNEGWQQGVEYHLVLDRVFTSYDRESGSLMKQSDAVAVYVGTFSVLPPPEVEAFAPTGDHVSVGASSIVTFSEAMDEASVQENFSVSPDLPGNLTLEAEGKELRFTPDEAWPFETEIAIMVAAGTKTAAGGFLPEDIQHSFKTIGPVHVLYTTPGDGASRIVTSASIRIVFDQAADHQSAQAAFTIQPAMEGDFSWEDNTMIFTPRSDLAYDSAYLVNIAAGIISVDGQDSQAEYNFAFSTAPTTFILNVASDLQDRPLSCEAAALKMALANKGVAVTESQIMEHVGYTEPSQRSNGVWGNPHIGFVGNIDGTQNTTGYGVYWEPIARAGNNWRPSEAFTGWNVTQLAQEVEAGNAVVVWGVYGSGYQDSWTTPDGGSVYAWKGEHTRTVIGFVGSVENPERIILNDPYAGQVSWTRAQFEQNWGIFGNAGVVVR
ncbi:MAG: Ig-like domain-containing protein [bacterium]|nr:Ig-like domain-containing protein [bacterium]